MGEFLLKVFHTNSIAQSTARESAQPTRLLSAHISHACDRADSVARGRQLGGRGGDDPRAKGSTADEGRLYGVGYVSDDFKRL